MYQALRRSLCSDEMANQPLAQPDLRDAALEPAPPVVLRAVAGPRPQRKVVTVVFIDVRDSMRLSRVIELEDWWSVSAGLFELMADGVHKFGGWVGNFTGDGIEAVFEATKRTDRHAGRACQAALWLRDAIRTPAAEIRTVHGLELSVRIGINSGEVVTGRIGRRHRSYYTANGYAVALAKRTETLAGSGRIYLTENTAALLTRDDTVQLHDLGAFEVKGADTPVEIFELVGNADQW
jgi:class 3 adenylate cyclase